MNTKDIHLNLFRKLEASPRCTQREISREMDLSLGKVNYCIKKLTIKGLIKIKNFNQSSNKLGYSYLLTTKGIEEITRLTTSFLKIKIKEYEMLKDEISKLKQDAHK